jgi:glutathione S-transferase
MTAPFRMYGGEASYFTAKARVALRAKRVFFEELLATPRAYREVLLPRTGLAFLPTIVTPEDETWQDTSDILDALEQRFPDIPLYPRTPVQRFVAHLWELYCDEFLVLPGLHYRWSFPESEWKARRDFAAINGDAVAANRLADFIQSLGRAAVGVTPETAPAIEAHTEALLDGLEAHFAVHPFLLGDRPSLADCSLMGPLYPHLYLDAVPARLLRERAPRTCHWIERMNRPEVEGFGEYLPGDALAETMRPLLAGIGRDAIPPLLECARAFDAWADGAAKADELPRSVGMHSSRVGGIPVQRSTSPYTVWMLQRPLDALRASSHAREAIERALAGTGCEALLTHAPRHRLGKLRFKLVFEDPAEGAL